MPPAELQKCRGEQASKEEIMELHIKVDNVHGEVSAMARTLQAISGENSDSSSRRCLAQHADACFPQQNL